MDSIIHDFNATKTLFSFIFDYQTILLITGTALIFKSAIYFWGSPQRQIVIGNVFRGHVQITNGETTSDDNRRKSVVVKLKKCQKESCDGSVTTSKQFNIQTVHGKRQVNITCDTCGEYELEI